MSRFAAVIAGVFRRYATWLVAISWKRFILLSVLLLIIAGVLSEIPPFTWPIMETAPKVSRLHTPSGDVDITIDEQGVQIKRKRQEDPGAAASLGQEIRREIIDEIKAERESSHLVRLGDFLPQLAFLFIVVSTAIKIAYAGRATAEARATEAQEMAEAESLKRQVVEARMAAMQAQVEPHFLFNTLASIDHLIEVDPPRASLMQKNRSRCCALRCRRCARNRPTSGASSRWCAPTSKSSRCACRIGCAPSSPCPKACTPRTS